VVKEGALDKGDITLGDGIPITIECKNEKKINLAGGQKELLDEMRNNGHEWGFTIHKKRGTTNVGEYYAVLPVEVMMNILSKAVPNLPKHEVSGGLEIPVKRRRVIARISDD
jgi:hypothetical protein